MSSDCAESSDNLCVVCFKNVDIYSVGNCDHMVCYECSTRMRVLCRQNECPICRQDLPKVIFSYSLKPFNEIVNSAPLEDKKYKIHFQNKKIQDQFYKLLEHSCAVCSNRVFKTFQHLHDHMRREHELYYCDLCVENLKIFTSERRCYTKADLGQHRRKGDPDDRSHRGHPLCEFCQIRFMDNDFLYRHLRKDHLYCHFCDADGHDLYYSSYDYLRDHFREEHYLCEEGACADEKFTPVFRTEIDLKAHRMSAHSKTMGKAAAKQARTLELEFTLKPRARQQDRSRKGRSTGFDIGDEGAAAFPNVDPPRVHSPTLDPSDFPSLPSGSGTVTVSSTQRRGRAGALTIQALGGRAGSLAITDENFPVLGEYHERGPGTSVRLNIKEERSNNAGRGGSAAAAAPRNVSIHVNHRHNGEQNIKIRQDEFPALSSSSGSQSVPSVKWVSMTNKKAPANPPSKQEKQQKQPLSDGDFPSLNAKCNANLNFKSNETLKPNHVNVRNGKAEGKASKKASSVVIPVREEGLDISEAGTSSLKAKVKKKKSKGGSNEERSDTAKKKEDGNDSKTIKEQSNSGKSYSSAFVGNSNNTKLVKPLPSVELSPQKSNDNSSDRQRPVKGNSAEAKKSAESGSESSKASTAASKSDRKAPPGFDQLNGVTKVKVTGEPPPGFSFDFPRSNGITFTNSSGQSFAIQTNYNYIPPPDFEKRNQNLVVKVFNILIKDSNLEQFKRVSAMFRQDLLSADDYCNHCIKAMGEDGFHEIFPELLILLPDINKQQELYQVFSRLPKSDAEKVQLITCETCRQVLCNSDIKEHLAQHTLQKNFPLLMPSTWTK